MNKKQQRIKNLETFVSAWENFAAAIPEDFGPQIWERLKFTVQAARCELNCLELLQKRDIATR